MLARAIVVCVDGDAFDVLEEFVERGSASVRLHQRPRRRGRSSCDCQAVFDAFGDREREQVIRRREHNRPAAR